MHTDNQSFAHIQIRCLTRLSETHCFELLTKISRIKLSAGTIWSDSAGFADAYAPPLAWAHHQAPQGPDRKDMTHLKKLEEGNENNFPHEEEEEGKNKKSLCFTSLSQRQLQGQFMCKRQRHFDTVSFCHWSYQRLLARSCCSKAAAPRLVLISGRVWEAGRWLGLLCVTWCLEAFMIMNVRSSPTKTYQ